MKVLLIAPYQNQGFQEKRTDFMPSGALLCLAAVLRGAGHIPVLLDLNNSRVHRESSPETHCINRIRQTLSTEKPELVGISCLFSGFMDTVRHYAQEIKIYAASCARHNLPIIIGGIHPTTFPVEILSNCDEFDCIALGEGERQIIEVADSISCGGENSMSRFSEIKSFAYRNAQGKVHVNRVREWLDYETLPMQAWDMVDFSDFEMDLSHYTNPKRHILKNMVPVISERGCPYKCNFCDMYLAQGRKLRRRSAHKFVDEIEYLVNEKGQRFFTFMDDNLTLDNRHIIEICNEILRRNLDIQFTTSGGLGVNSLRPEVIDAMVAAGMVSALLAIEHGSDYIRNHVIGKNLQRDTIFQVVDELRRYPQINLAAGWIMGFPEDTNETLQATMDMIDDLKLDRNWVGNLIPFPGTPVFDQCVRDDLFIEKINVSSLWHTPIRAFQNSCVIKPYAMKMEEMQLWQERFLAVRFKYLRKF
jgi:radical SAM superfamily enzyme YgiQ (UPF0313 family)